LSGKYRISGNTNNTTYINAFSFNAYWQSSTLTYVQIDFPNYLYIVGYTIKKLGNNNPTSWRIFSDNMSQQIMDTQTNVSLPSTIGTITKYKLTTSILCKNLKFVYNTSDGNNPALSGLQYYCDFTQDATTTFCPIPTDSITNTIFNLLSNNANYDTTSSVNYSYDSHDNRLIFNGNYNFYGVTDRNTQNETNQGCFKAFTFMDNNLNYKFWQISPSHFPSSNPIGNTVIPTDTYVQVTFPNPLYIVGYTIKKLGRINNPTSWQIISMPDNTIIDYPQNVSLDNITIGSIATFKVNTPKFCTSLKFLYISSDKSNPCLAGLQFYCNLDVHAHFL
jgi:hypothetical protein